MSKKNMKPKKISSKLQGLRDNKEKNKETELYQYQNSDITQLSDDKLWIEAETLKNNISISFIELGKRLVELQERYSKNKTGSFQKMCIEKGWKKTEVQTLITKYKEYNVFRDNGRDATNLKEAAFKIENASQKTMAEFKKAPMKVKDEFVEGKLNGAVEIRKATNRYNAKEIIDAEIVEAEEVKTEEEKKKELINKIKDMEKDIKDRKKDIRKRERNLKKLIEEKEKLLQMIL